MADGGEFLYEVVVLVDGPDSLEHSIGGDADGAAEGIVVLVIPDEAVDVGIEYEANEVTLAVYDRAAGVAADDVVSGDEVEGFFPVGAAG